MSAPEDQHRSGWDTGYVPLTMVLVGYVAAAVPVAGCLAPPVLAGATGLIVAGCIALGDHMEGQRVSRVIWWTIGLALLLPVWTLMLRAMLRL